MHIPVIKGVIKRRLLVNFRMAAEVMQRLLPAPFRPKLHQGHAIAGICLIRLEEIRPFGLPSFIGLASENAAHRFAIEWVDEQGSTREGVFIPRRDTNSRFNQLAGGRIFPGEHHFAKFNVEDANGSIDFQMESADAEASIRLKGRASSRLPADSCFESLADASQFFDGGSLGYSVTRDPRRLDGLQLRTREWRVSPLEVLAVESAYFADTKRFPKGSIMFDHALVMRNLQHEWHQAAGFVIPGAGAAEVI